MERVLMLDGLTMVLSLATEPTATTALFMLDGDVITAKWHSNMWMQV